MREVIISNFSNYILVTIRLKGEEVAGWELIQDIKDQFFKDLDFIEVYPKKEEIINKANERHLIHIKKGFECPKMGDFKQEAYYTEFKQIDENLKVISESIVSKATKKPEPKKEKEPYNGGELKIVLSNYKYYKNYRDNLQIFYESHVKTNYKGNGKLQKELEWLNRGLSRYIRGNK